MERKISTYGGKKEAKKKTNPSKDEKRKNGDLIQFLREKKARDGRLNKLGEWLLANEGDTGWRITEGSMKYILR